MRGFLDSRIGDNIVIRDQENENDQPQDVGEAPEVSVIDLEKGTVRHLLKPNARSPLSSRSPFFFKKKKGKRDGWTHARKTRPVYRAPGPTIPIGWAQIPCPMENTDIRVRTVRHNHPILFAGQSKSERAGRRLTPCSFGSQREAARIALHCIASQY